MRVTEQVILSGSTISVPADEGRALDDQAHQDPAHYDWAEQTRRVLTRDLLVRAAYAAPGEARALEFRALHLNLPLVGAVAARLGLDGDDALAAEHEGLDGLLEAVRAFDPYGEAEFVEVAVPYVEQRLQARPATRALLPRRRPVRLVMHRLALAVAGCRV